MWVSPPFTIWLKKAQSSNINNNNRIIIVKNWNVISADPVWPAAVAQHVRILKRRTLSPPMELLESTKAIYLLWCPCDLQYIGKTIRPVQTHIIEHKSATRRKDKKLSLAPHFNEAGHSVSTLSVCVVQQISRSRRGMEKKLLQQKVDDFFIIIIWKHSTLLVSMRTYPSRVIFSVSSMIPLIICHPPPAWIVPIGCPDCWPEHMKTLGTVWHWCWWRSRTETFTLSFLLVTLFLLVHLAACE